MDMILHQLFMGLETREFSLIMTFLMTLIGFILGCAISFWLGSLLKKELLRAFTDDGISGEKQKRKPKHDYIEFYDSQELS